MRFKLHLKALAIIALLLSGSFKGMAQADSVYWTFGTPGVGNVFATFSSNGSVPASACIADTGNNGLITSNNGYVPLFLTNQFSSAGYYNASGQPSMRANALPGSFNINTTSYISFLVDPQPGYILTITGIYFAGLSGGPFSAPSYLLRTSADNYASDVGIGVFTTTYGAKKEHPSLSITNGIPGDAIEVRLYMYGGFFESTGGTNFFDDMVIYYMLTASASITTGTIAGSPFCAGASVSVPFTTSGTFNTGNIFTAQLSDASGSFATPVDVGTLAGTTPGTISATIPTSTTTGTGYRIRVVGSNPAITGADNGTDLVINSPVTPSVSITSNNNNVCAGTSIIFTASPTNGTNVEWFVNGTGPVATGNTYTTTTLANNDVVTAVVTTSATCYTAQTDTSNAITMTVNANLTPDVSIIASATVICPSTSVIFTATPVNGGTTPAYQWFVNGLPVGTNSNIYTNSGFTNNDVITAVLTTSETCYTSPTDTSTAITLTVNSTVTPDVTIVSTGDTICSGGTITFTATPVNGGTTPVIEWFVNGVSVSTGTTYTPGSIDSSDVVTAVLTSNDPCASAPTDTSNEVTVIVNTNITPTVTVTVSPGTTVDTGTVVTFTANSTNGGTNPVYQWYNNGVPVGTGGDTYIDSMLTTDDSITVELISSDPCAISTDTSDPVIMIVNPLSISTVNTFARASIYPNPTQGSFTLVLSPVNGEASVVITDITGREVYSRSFTVQQSQFIEQINLEDIAQGIYPIRVKTNNTTYTEKLQIQR